MNTTIAIAVAAVLVAGGVWLFAYRAERESALAAERGLAANLAAHEAEARAFSAAAAAQAQELRARVERLDAIRSPQERLTAKLRLFNEARGTAARRRDT